MWQAPWRGNDGGGVGEGLLQGAGKDGGDAVVEPGRIGADRFIGKIDCLFPFRWCSDEWGVGLRLWRGR